MFENIQCSETVLYFTALYNVKHVCFPEEGKKISKNVRLILKFYSAMKVFVILWLFLSLT